jgi:bacterial/archaeal transporter family-2 protein
VAPRIGAAGFAAATIFGSAVAALAIDHYGWLGFPARPLDATRLAGAGCLLAGVALLQGGRG